MRRHFLDLLIDYTFSLQKKNPLLMTPIEQKLYNGLFFCQSTHFFAIHGTRVIVGAQLSMV